MSAAIPAGVGNILGQPVREQRDYSGPALCGAVLGSGAPRLDSSERRTAFGWAVSMAPLICLSNRFTRPATLGSLPRLRPGIAPLT